MNWRVKCHAQRYKTTNERFWEKVDKSGSCWLWTGCKDKDGYGFFRHKGKNLKAHRFVLELIGVTDVTGLVCHSCDTPSCVNPAHLFVGDNYDNQRDAANKGRCRAQKLSRDDVDRILESSLFGAKAKDLAHIYGVSKTSIYAIRSKRTWGHAHQ